MAKTVMVKDKATGETFLLYSVDAREQMRDFPDRYDAGDDESAAILRRPKSNTTKKDVLSGKSPDVTDPPPPVKINIKHADKPGQK